MIDTSTELFNAFLEDTRQIMVKVTIGDRVFDNDNIATLSLEYGSMDGGSLDIGGAFANSLKIGFSELVEGLKELDEIEVELGAVLPDETIEYVKMGTFIINEEVMMDRNNNTTSIDAMDRMVMLGETYEPTLEGDYAQIIDIAVDIANQAGVVVSSDFDRLRTDSILIPREKTLREAIGIIAQFEVGFATFNRDGELTIRGLKDVGFNVSPEEYTMKGLVKNEVPFRLNGVQCTIGDGEDDVLTSGGTRGNQIYLQNESMTQEHLTRIHQSLTSLNYYPFTLDWYGHPALEAGDWIEIEDLQGNKFKTPNLHYTLDFNGGLKAKSQAETTSSSEVVYQYKSPLKQEIQAIAARLSASGGNHVYDDLTEPENPKEGDLWFKPEGPDTLILKYTRLEDGTLDWVEELNTGDTTKNAREIEAAIEEVEEAKQQAKQDAEQALADAKAHAEAEDARVKQEIGLEVDGAIEIAEQAKADAVTKANKALADAKVYADAEILQFSEHFDGVLAEVESDVADAQATADSAVEQIDTAVSNAGFASLDDTIQNMNYITMNAEQSAQQAITEASNAYGLAQTSISEAQTAQANSLTALGKAEDALVGVSDLDIRVDDVEAELTMKADNTFMTEDGELTTLSNAITFNAHRFSSDMSRIESRVESLAGEINLVILKDAHVGKVIRDTDIYPNPTQDAPDGRDTMRELIEVSPNEQLAFSKKNGSGWVRIQQYDDSYNNIQPLSFNDEERIVTTLPNAKYIWISYPRGSQPQLVRGTDFIPYRPNLVDQMTSDEVVLFRNEYDEFADRTERRLTTVDSSGGRLETAENLITQTADGLNAKVDLTTFNELTGEVESLGTEFDVVAGQVSSKVWMTDIDGIEIGGRNYFVIKDALENRIFGWATGLPTGETGSLASGFIPVSKNEEFILNHPTSQLFYYDVNKNNLPLGMMFGGEVIKVPNNDDIAYMRISFRDNFLGGKSKENVRIKLEKGNKATDWTPAPEDTTELINHVESELTQKHDSITGTVSDLDGRVVEQQLSIDGIENTIQATQDDLEGTKTLLNTTKSTVDGHVSTIATLRTDVDGKATITQFNTLETTVDGSLQRIGDAEGNITQIETNVSGLQTTVADKASQSQVTQLANGFSTLVTDFNELEVGGRNLFKNTSETYTRVTVGRDGWFSREYTLEELGVVGDSWYTLSADLMTNNAIKLRIDWNGLAREYGDPIYKNGRYHISFYIPSNANRFRWRIYPADDDKSGYNAWFRKEKLEKGNMATEWTAAPEDVQSQITQLSDNINLRVTKGDLLSQINIEAGRTLIQSNSLVLDANTIVKGDFGVSGGNVTLDADTRIQGTFTVSGGNVLLDSATTVTGGFTVLGKNIILDGDTTVRDNFTVTGGNIILDGKTTVHDDFTVTGGNVVLNADTRVQGTFTVSGGNVILDGNTTVRGGFTVLGENVTLDGNTTVLGDFSVFGKNITLDADTTVLGDFSVFGKNIILDGDTTVTGDFTVGGEIVGSGIRADHITTGKLDAGQITVVNLDVSSLSGKTSEFVQSAWNSAAGGNVRATGDGIVTTSVRNSQTYMQNGVIGSRNRLGGGLGHLGVDDLINDDYTYVLQTSNGTKFKLRQVMSNASGDMTWLDVIELSSPSNINNSKAYIRSYNVYMQGHARIGQISMNDGNINSVDNVYANYFRLRNGGYIRANSANSTVDIKSLTFISLQTGSGEAFKLDNTHGYMYRTLSMEGNDITNQSDRRLKLNIEETNVNSLEEINSMTFVEFDRTNGNHDEIGVIAQDTPSLALYDSERDMWSINSSKQIMMNSHAIQQLYFEFDERVESNEEKIHKLQQELSQANRRIEELEGVI